ncbi:serine/threonine protein kinase [Hyalangium minutum]|uniref:Serine/threonine-protein kinase Pkn6 n=1 Tax=Hyalangium minutum TaxID=394096 RepID=A0A085WJU1_9BACT|nr:serine/threonine-protein kinase [Hyalangium minutum]KFE67954.1 Serine/threonine-protein kinase Pkn6 [Hyalangium minutum]
MAVPFGKYELLRKIASGGMGQVFLARERSSVERLVVLKLILPHLAEDDEFLTMFLEEARLVARLQHPNLVTILDLQEVEGRHCLAMEYVQGDDVRRLDKQSRLKGRLLPAGLVLRVISEAAAGLDYAHKARDAQGQPLKLVHRDVSPQNILVGFDGAVKIIDFGVAKAAGSGHHTATGVLKGKYPYMSPEQASGQAIDGRSDQFALGVVMWELLTGRRLFKGESDMMTLRLVKDCQVPKPSQINPKLPPGLDEVVLRALATTPDKRYPDCGALRLALEDYIIQLRLPASTAHLSAFLRELYADRIAAESDPAKLDQLAEDTDLDTKDKSNPSRIDSLGSPGHRPTPSRVSMPSMRSRHSVEALVGPAPGHRQESTRGTQPLGRPTPQRRFPLIPVVVSSAALLVIAGAALVYFTQKPDASQPPPVVANPPMKPVEPPPVPRPQTAAPLKVELVLKSEPTGAAVQLAGKPLGVTPVTLAVAPEEAPLEVTLSLDGYEPLTRHVSAANAPSLMLALERRAAPTKPPTNGTSKKPPPSYIKKGR